VTFTNTQYTTTVLEDFKEMWRFTRTMAMRMGEVGDSKVRADLTSWLRAMTALNPSPITLIAAFGERTGEQVARHAFANSSRTSP
jgi:hypothetical protein